MPTKFDNEIDFLIRVFCICLQRFASSQVAQTHKGCHCFSIFQFWFSYFLFIFWENWWTAKASSLNIFWQLCSRLLSVSPNVSFDSSNTIEQYFYEPLWNWSKTMDNGYLNRTKNHQTSKVVGFLGRSVACPDKIIGKIF